MTSLPLFADVPPKSLTACVAALLQARPREWVSMQELAKVGGCGGWRTRLSNCRYPPFNMTIENRNFRRRLPSGKTVTVSEYRYVPGGTVTR